MLIWRGLGCITIPIYLVTLWIFQCFLIKFYGISLGREEYLLIGVGLVIAGIINWIVGWLLNQSGERHDLFFIKSQYWSLLIPVGFFIYFMVQREQTQKRDAFLQEQHIDSSVPFVIVDNSTSFVNDFGFKLQLRSQIDIEIAGIEANVKVSDLRFGSDVKKRNLRTRFAAGIFPTSVKNGEYLEISGMEGGEGKIEVLIIRGTHQGIMKAYKFVREGERFSLSK